MKNLSDGSSRRWYPAILFLGFMLILFSRRRAQWTSPQVWSEDGVLVLAGFFKHGWLSLLEPVNGYLISVPKLVSGLSLSMSVFYYPIISTVLSCVFSALVCLAIVFAPTRLRGRLACAIAVLAVPSDPEVFALPLYTFWWASLLLLLLVLWREETGGLVWRLVFLALGGLSSPVILLVLPLLYGRAILYRRYAAEWLLALAATAIAALQAYHMVADSAGSMPPLSSLLQLTVPVFFGNYLLGNFVRVVPATASSGHGLLILWFASAVMLALLAGWLFRTRRDIVTWTLLFLLAGSVALSVARVDPALLQPGMMGPRYFYFPFILMSWAGVQLFYGSSDARLRSLMVALALLVLCNAARVWSRGHDDLRWAEHLRSCRMFPVYSIPVHTTGVRDQAWTLQLPGTTCEQALQDEPLAAPDRWEGRPTFPYTVLSGVQGTPVTLLTNAMPGSDYAKSQLTGYRVLGSYASGDADTGSVRLSLRRGDRLVYRSGPGRAGLRLEVEGHACAFLSALPSAPDWVTLDFSNRSLPERFTVLITDDGKGWGEWLAVAIQEQ